MPFKRGNPGCCECVTAICFVRVTVLNGCGVGLQGATAEVVVGGVLSGSAVTDANGVALIPLSISPGLGAYTLNISRSGYNSHSSVRFGVFACAAGTQINDLTITLLPPSGFAVIRCQEPVSTATTFSAAWADTDSCWGVSFSGTLTYHSSDSNGVGSWRGCLDSDWDVNRQVCSPPGRGCDVGPLALPFRFSCDRLDFRASRQTGTCAPLSGVVCYFQTQACNPDDDSAGCYVPWSGGVAMTVTQCDPFVASITTGTQTYTVTQD